MSEHAFSETEQTGLYRAIYERRDVRSRFLSDPVPQATLDRLLDAAHHAPSVGFMQPTRIIVVRDVATRHTIRESFERANLTAQKQYEGERGELYRSLKLEAIVDAPLNICFVCENASERGHGLGRQTMPEAAVYSTVCAVQNFWLAARAEGIGVGWVSILDREDLCAALAIPPNVLPVAYLCVGFVENFDERPQLEQRGWEARVPLHDIVHIERFGNLAP